MADDDEPRINLGYPYGQLLKALEGTREQASEQAERWRRVLSGLLDGSLRVGSRTPVADAPPWVTLEVVRGGFATGQWAAAGPLQPHELDALGVLDEPPRSREMTDRGALNRYFLSDAGRPELSAMLATGRFHIHIPEEGALIVAMWLLEQGEGERVAQMIETLTPFFDHLRFYPVPYARPSSNGEGVYVQTVGATIARLRAKRPQEMVEKMNEAIQVWTPLYDQAIGLFLETVEGDVPVFPSDHSGQMLRQPSGQPVVAGGWPCRRYAVDWAPRARQVLRDYDDARARHTLCGKPEKAGESFAQLRTYLASCVDDPSALTGRDVAMIRKILASFVTRHGAPGSARLRATRAMQAVEVARPRHHLLAQVLADRLQEYPEDEGAPEVEAHFGPLSAGETART